MYLEFLIEDASGCELINKIMNKYKEMHTEVEFRTHLFKGIGYPRKTKPTDDTKTRKLLTDLPIYLRGISKQIEALGRQAAIIVILDNDRRDCVDLKKQLIKIAEDNNASNNSFFCIAIEEMEAWLLGDLKAVRKAYPMMKNSALNGYINDSIVGTWELLANVIYAGGINRLKYDCPTYREIGMVKCEWALKIGEHMDLYQNESPSFRYFIKKLDKIIENSK